MGASINRDQTTTDTNNVRYWGAAHSGGQVLNYCLGDGSVKTCRFDMDGTALSNLLNRTDRNKIDWDLVQ